jgi:hypothetical protein
MFRSSVSLLCVPIGRELTGEGVGSGGRWRSRRRRSRNERRRNRNEMRNNRSMNEEEE